MNLHLFRVVSEKNPNGFKQKKKDLKIHNTPPPPGFFDDPEQMPDAQKMHRRRVRFFPPLSLFDRGLRKKFSDILETFAD